MKASLIISVYKNTSFLRAVLDSLKHQTEKDFEIIISEDGNSAKMKEFVDSYPFEQPYQHITQEDLGWRKNHILNKAIRASKSDWLIFIDGDCILHNRFIEMHLRYAAEGLILAGKRVKLDSESTEKMLRDSNYLSKIQEVIWGRLLLGKGKIKFPEEGLFISPDSPFSFLNKLRKNEKLLGCNMSFSKNDIYSINGFDEDYIRPAFGEDRDLSWRFDATGKKHFSLRNLALVYHMDHAASWSSQEENLKLYKEKRSKKEFFCRNGLVKSWTWEEKRVVS